jgi:hypothetical protein
MREHVNILFIISLLLMNCLMIYSMLISNVNLFVIAEIGTLLDMFAFWRLTR